jgi:hypothetical protein
MKKFKFALLALLFLPLIPAHAAVTTSSILNLINAERSKARLSPVVNNAKLTEAAQMKADDMLSKGYFAHVGPDGKDPLSWYAKVGYNWSWAGEILALSQNTESDTAIMTAWMNSPEHRFIIMDLRYTETGIGIAIGTYQGQQTVFVAEEFGLPKVIATAPAPTPVAISIPTQAPTQAQVPSIPVPVQTITKTTNIKSQVTQPIKPVAVAKSVVKKVEAEVLASTSTAAVIQSSAAPVALVEHVFWFTRIRNFLANIFTFFS